MDKVFYLMHQHESEYGIKQIKGLGMYSSETEIERAIQRYKQKEGFKNYPKGFLVKEFIIDQEIDDGAYDSTKK